MFSFPPFLARRLIGSGLSLAISITNLIFWNFCVQIPNKVVEIASLDKLVSSGSTTRSYFCYRGWEMRCANRELALRCWEAAKVGQDPQGLIVHHDRDSVCTSYRWLSQLLIEEGVAVSYCKRGAKDNPWMESFWAHLKGENMSLFLEAATLEELEWVIEKQMGYYNNERRHSRLEYRSPVEYLASVGFIPKTLAEIGLESGSVSEAQARMVAVVIRQFTPTRNDFLFGVTLTNHEWHPIMVALAYLAGKQAVQWNLSMASSILAALPPFLIYMIFQTLVHKRPTSYFGGGLRNVP